MSAQASLLPGNRLHLNHGPIDLIISADGDARDVRRAYQVAAAMFPNILPELVAKLAVLRSDTIRALATDVLSQLSNNLCYLNNQVDSYFFSRIPNLNRMILDKKELFAAAYAMARVLLYVLRPAELPVGMVLAWTGAAAILAAGNVSIEQGGAQAIVAGGMLSVDRGGSGLAIARRIHIGSGGLTVFSITPRLEVAEGGRVIFGRVASFAVLGGVLAGLATLIGRAAVRRGRESPTYSAQASCRPRAASSSPIRSIRRARLRAAGCSPIKGNG